LKNKKAARRLLRKERDGMVEKYVKIFYRRNLLATLLPAIFVFLPLFVVSLFYDVIDGDIWISFFPFPLAALLWCFAALYTVRFRKMIEEQESLYRISFCDNGAIHLETTLYLSEDWLIFAGSVALYKKHIRSVRAKSEIGRVGSSYKVTLRTVTGKKYVVWCLSHENVERIKKWKKI
jgi:hypothetical protein